MININFVGDFVICSSVEVSFEKILRSSDFNIVNFEAPIKTAYYPNLKSGPSIQQDPSAPLWLKENCFNAFSLANNHIMDFGEKAARKTVAVLGYEKCVGIGEGIEAYKPLLLEKNGIKVAILALAELQFGMVHDSFTQANDYGCAWINHPCVNRLVRETKKKVDFLIIVAHAGLEGVDVPLPEWRDRYRELIDEGGDAVVGGHTHTAQGYEVYHGKPIFYSLGNFCFQENLTGKDSWNIGECVSLKLSKDGKLEFEVYGIQLVDGNKLMLVDEKVWIDKFRHLNQLLETPGYISHVNEICRKAMVDYNTLFSMGGYIHIDRHIVRSLARWLLGRCKDVHVLNNIQCESHRWTIVRALRLKNNLK